MHITCTPVTGEGLLRRLVSNGDVGVETGFDSTTSSVVVGCCREVKELINKGGMGMVSQKEKRKSTYFRWAFYIICFTS